MKYGLCLSVHACDRAGRYENAFHGCLISSPYIFPLTQVHNSFQIIEIDKNTFHLFHFIKTHLWQETVV
jgi:hypothetical protein